MDFEVSGRAAAGDLAAVLVAREDLLADAGRDGGGGALGGGGIEGAEVLGVAGGAFEDLGRDVDLATGAVLGGAPAVGALLVGDLVGGTAGAGAGREDGAAEGLDEVGVAEIGA